MNTTRNEITSLVPPDHIPELRAQVHRAVPAQLLPHAVRQVHPQGGAEDAGAGLGCGCGGRHGDGRCDGGGVREGTARRGLPYLQVTDTQNTCTFIPHP